MSKYKALFVEESREHLAELSRLLVSLEAAGDAAPIVEEMFRRVHSIKGMAASMGYEPIAELAHALEDVFARQRREGVRPAPAQVDLLLKAVDALVAQVAQAEAGAAVAVEAELRARLVAAGKAEAQVEPPAPRGADAPAALGERRWRVRVVVAADCATPAVRLFMAQRALAALGRVEGMSPSVEELRAGRAPERALTLELVGVADEPALRQAIAGVVDITEVDVQAVTREPTDKPAAEAAADPSRGLASIRVRTEVLDQLIDNVGELFILRERLAALVGGEPRPELRVALDALAKAIRAIHGQVMAVRMVPLRLLTDRYPRLVRDLARTLGKEIELSVDGAELELDRAILEALDEPLVHTLRNAVDHGIEAAAARVAAGKPAAGRLRLSAARDRDTVVVVLEDDGGGIDVEAVRRRAVALRLIGEAQAEALSAREVLFLICLPGFSTKQAASQLSGRGVGMDVVRNRIEALGGTLDIESEAGSGTRFTLRLPLTVAIIHVLLVEAGGRRFALPVAKVVAVHDTGEDTLKEAGGATYLSFRHALAPVFDLARLLGLGDGKPAGQAVVIEDGRDLMAVAVERVVGYHEVVVKPLGEPLDRLEWFSGAAVLADGQPVLILDAAKALRLRWAA